MGKTRGCAPGSMVLLTRLAKQAYRRSDDELLGIQLRHLVALSYMRDHDACPQQDLADAFCMDANNVVLLLNELEQVGYATRLRDPLDRRRHLVQLTPAGREALARAEEAEGRSRTRCSRRSTIQSARRCMNFLRAHCAASSRPTAKPARRPTARRSRRSRPEHPWAVHDADRHTRRRLSV